MTNVVGAAYSADEMMAIAAARLLRNDDVCFVGIGAPSLAYGEFHPMTVVGVTAAAWLILSALYEPVSRWRAGQSLSRGAQAVS